PTRLVRAPRVVNASYREHAGGERRGLGMARTPLMGRVQHAVSVVAEATERKVPVEQVLEERTTRRELRKRAGAGGGAAAGTSSASRSTISSRASRTGRTTSTT